MANQDVSTQILGFSRVEQIDENMKALDVLKKWTKEIEAKCEACLRNGPEVDIDFKTFGPRTQRRAAVIVDNKI